MLEAGIYDHNAFVTLTYEQDRLELDPVDLQNFMKALRKKIAPMKVRFYAVGEYGEKNDRPHYHLALFGYPSCKRKKTRGLACSCTACTTLRDSWRKGFILNGNLEIASARYVARYVVKKMNHRDDPRLHNRQPEFARMSLRPGVGHGILDNVAAVITRYNLLTPEGDVPVTLRHGSQEYPLGRYLRKQLRLKLGLNEKSPQTLSPDAAYRHYHSEENQIMRAMQEAARSDPQNPSLRYHLLKFSKPRSDQLVRRHQIQKKKGPL